MLEGHCVVAAAGVCSVGNTEGWKAAAAAAAEEEVEPDEAAVVVVVDVDIAVGAAD
jgi:hypothetical protein